MDDQNVLSITDNLQSLSDDFNKWQSLTYNQRKESDIICMDKYGMTNIQLYNLQLSKLSKYNDDIPTVRVDSVTSEGTIKVDEDPDLYTTADKIQYSNLLQTQNPNIIIINDFENSIIPDYNLQDLMSKYNAYCMLPDEHKDLSNGYSLKIWGKTVPQMFIDMKSKLESKEVDPYMWKQLENFLLPSLEIQSMNIQLENSIASKDFIKYNVDLIDYGVYNESDIPVYKEDKYGYTGEVPAVTPYFDPDEYNSLNSAEGDVTPFDYIFIQNPKGYYKVIHDLQTKLSSAKDPVLEDDIKSNIVKLGWNPYVPINGESIKFARDKQKGWLDTNYRSQIVNLTSLKSDNSIDKDYNYDDNNQLYPIYLIIEFRDPESTAHMLGLFFDDTAANIYGIQSNDKFNRVNLYHPQDISGYVEIFCILVDRHTWDVMGINANDAYENHKSFSSNYWFPANMYKEKMAIDQFMDFILKMVNINGTPYQYNSQLKAYLIYKGNADKFISNSFNIHQLLQMQYKGEAFIDSSDVASKLLEMNIDNFNISTNDDNINKIIKEIKNYISPKPAFVPIKKPDIKLESIKDIEDAYMESYNILQESNQSDLYKVKVQLARLGYLNHIVESKFDNDPNYSIMKDRIVTEFNTYYKFVKAAEPDFNLNEFSKTTEYNIKNNIHTNYLYSGDIF